MLLVIGSTLFTSVTNYNWKGFRIAGVGERSSSTATYVNPVIENNHPDPAVIRLPNDEGYVMVSSSNLAIKGTNPAFPILHSLDLINWELVS